MHSGLIELLENEAPLAAVMGHEIAHAHARTHVAAAEFPQEEAVGDRHCRHICRGLWLDTLSDIAGLVNAAIVNGHQRTLENQSDRVGLQYMINAGYDPRQAPAVWKVMAKESGDQVTDFFWSSHDNHATRRSYLMNELKNNYRDLDYAPLALKADEYGRIKAAVKDAKNPKRKLKIS